MYRRDFIEDRMSRVPNVQFQIQVAFQTSPKTMNGYRGILGSSLNMQHSVNCKRSTDISLRWVLKISNSCYGAHELWLMTRVLCSWICWDYWVHLNWQSLLWLLERWTASIWSTPFLTVWRKMILSRTLMSFSGH